MNAQRGYFEARRRLADTKRYYRVTDDRKAKLDIAKKVLHELYLQIENEFSQMYPPKSVTINNLQEFLCNSPLEFCAKHPESAKEFNKITKPYSPKVNVWYYFLQKFSAMLGSEEAWNILEKYYQDEAGHSKSKSKKQKFYWALSVVAHGTLLEQKDADAYSEYYEKLESKNKSRKNYDNYSTELSSKSSYYLSSNLEKVKLLQQKVFWKEVGLLNSNDALSNKPLSPQYIDIYIKPSDRIWAGYEGELHSSSANARHINDACDTTAFGEFYAPPFFSVCCSGLYAHDLDSKATGIYDNT